MTLIFLFVAFLIFLLCFKRSTISFEGNNWYANKLIINDQDVIYRKDRKTFVIYPTQIIVNDWVDSLIIINPNFEYRYKLKIEKNKFNQDIAILKSKNILLNDTLLIKLDTLDDNYNRSRKFIVKLESKKTLISFSRSISTTPVPFQPRKPVRGLP